MSIQLHFVNGRTIVSCNSIYGRWKIQTRVGKYKYFKLLSDARRWAKDNPIAPPSEGFPNVLPQA